METAFETLVLCLPSAGLAEINPFPVSLLLVSLPADFISHKRPNLRGGPPEPPALAPLRPSYAKLPGLAGHRFSLWALLSTVQEGWQSLLPTVLPLKKKIPFLRLH